MISENIYGQWTDRDSEADDRRKTGVNRVVQFPCPNTRAELPHEWDLLSDLFDSCFTEASSTVLQNQY